ncbi:MAG: amidase [Chloroflexota bacterium]
MSDQDLVYLTIAEAGALIASKSLSPVELAEAVFRRIEATDGRLNSYNRLMRASALAEARAAEQRAAAGTLLGPLDGIPIGVKDLYDTAGVITTGGTGAYRQRVPAQDATTVRLLRQAGAVIVGKTNTHELALGGTTNNAHYGPSRNPWNTERVPGGSSGGSGSAVAAGQALGALGTDTGGSIRIPAAFCGITGHKPSHGLVGRGGVLPLSLTLDHAGPMTRSALDCALMLTVLAGYDPRDLDSVRRPHENYAAGIDVPVAGLKVAIVPSLLAECQPAVLDAFEGSLGVLRALGVEIGEVEPMAGFDDWRAEMQPIMMTEAASYNEKILDDVPPTVSEPIRTMMNRGFEVKAVAYQRALDFRKLMEQRYEHALADGGYAAYVTPTSPQVAEPIAPDPTAEPPQPLKFRNTSVFNQNRQPSISLPNGFDGDGLPTGLMVSAARWQDATALRIAHAVQQVTDWHTRRPALAG